MSDYTCKIKIDAPAEKLYQAIITQEGLKNWWTQECHADPKPGGKATLLFGNTYAIMQYENLTPCSNVTWKCVDQYHEANPPLKKKNEWTGTRVIFQIEKIDANHSELHFTHQGLKPSMECYAICENGWNHFIKTSLKNYVETGKGENYQHRHSKTHSR